jgi:hypothetical protein
VKRDVLLPSEIMNLPPASPENGISGCYIIPAVGAYGLNMSGEYIAEFLFPKSKDVKDFEPRKESEQYLIPWDDEDLYRLSLKQRPVEGGAQVNFIEKEEQQSESSLFKISRKN